MTKHEPGIFKRFYKHNPVKKLQQMTDEEVMEAIDKYLDQFIKGYESRNGKYAPLPDIQLQTINDIRNKRTNISKKPIIPGRRPYK
jgi:non-homologous end joining protein Ku